MVSHLSSNLSKPTDEAIQSVGEDGQLTIRIPNPRVYMARQSQWKGRRGKPRCDHCRVNNLKCDRVLPTCNNCSWANGRQCIYTPLPTPAHRGIPRCDRCRFANLKCDRNLPVCSHCAEGGISECNYTPKKRHKVPLDHGTMGEKHTGPYGPKTASFLVSEVPSNDDVSPHGDSGDGHNFYGQNVASSSTSHASSSQSPQNRMEDSESAHSSRLTPESRDRRWALHPPLSSLAPRQAQSANQVSFITHSFPSEGGLIVATSLIQSWKHPLFAPLPDAVVHRISSVNVVEMPDRTLFEEALGQFLTDLPAALRETTAFGPEMYAAVCRSLSGDSAQNISDRLRMWLTYHHVRLGSEKHYLLLIPRDAFFHLLAPEEEILRRDYVAYVDNHSEAYGTTSGSRSENADHDVGGFEWTRAFERIPVLNQIYDILVYAHRAHGSSSSVLFEARRIGMAGITWPMVEMFINLCPLCNLRNESNGAPGDERVVK
ncbi:hypothetical protein BKA82DRAFT_931443 [Pisolithus tinctorius]|uniref:Zn(2)-C6 fungal-type domain-containing protein n=1 Tax=Pisolithus tinctorius Marx 270 TaxID=870435 RepID=A0A0C3PML4_PISTI|nr:hypothetical protein BKA82DRAFT_931443 [Pisolithus tinctorius]KIO10066.1 hypothetical protein M404DRAFT_931443 [Pisolithus tinctorius Marx 270]